MDTIREIVKTIAGELAPLVIIISFVGLVVSGWAFLRKRLSAKDDEIGKLENAIKCLNSETQDSIKKLKDERDKARDERDKALNGLTRVALEKADQQVQDGNEEKANTHLMEWLDLEAPLIAEVCRRLARWRLSAAQDEQHGEVAVPLMESERLITIARALNPENRQLRDLKYELLISKHNQDPAATVDDLMRSLADEYDNLDPFILSKYAQKYDEAGKYHHALALRERATDVLRRTAGPNDRDTLTSQNNLASVLRALNRLEESEALQRETWEARKEHLGPNDRDTLRSQHNLAFVLHDLNRLEESEALHRETWEARKKHLGPNDRDTLRSQNNLAEVLRAFNRLEESEALATATAVPGDDAGKSEAQPHDVPKQACGIVY